MSTAIKPNLESAILNKNLSKVQALFFPDDLDCNDYEGDSSLLHLAAMYSNLDIVAFLVTKGADVNRRGGTFDAPAVTYAAESGFADIVRYLVEAGSDLDTSHALRNPLLRACQEGQADVVLFLLDETDIDPHLTYRIPSGKLINAMTNAKASGHEETMQALAAHGCSEPIEGVDTPVWEPPAHQMVNQDSNQNRFEEIVQYMQVRFGPVIEACQQEILSPVEGMSVSINAILPNEVHPYLVLFTNGMSSRPMNCPAGKEDWKFAELVIQLPPDWPVPFDADIDPKWRWPIEWLRRMAYYPHLDKTWLGSPAAIVSSADPPEPLGQSTHQTCLLLYPDFSNLNAPLQRQDGDLVHFYTVVPLFTEERDYEIKYGMQSFFERIVDCNIPMIVDISRPKFTET